MEDGMGESRGSWPDLPYTAWRETYATLHLWMQIVGKVRLSLTPWLNHSWHVTLYVTARGLTTSPIFHGERAFEIDFDFLDHVLRIETSDGSRRQIELHPRAVADFYAELMAALTDLGIRVKVNEWPNELPDPIRFSEDRVHAALRSRIRLAFLADPPAGRPRAQDVPNRVHRKMQPRPLLLGQFRFGGDTVLWPAGATASGRRPEPSGQGHSRGLFP